MSKIVLADKDLPRMLIKFLDNDGQIQSVEVDNIVVYYVPEKQGLGIAFCNEGHWVNEFRLVDGKFIEW